MIISRRTLLGAAGSLIVGGGLAQTGRAAPRIHLRLLETSDLHMFVLDWDYYHSKNDPTVGLAKVADLVERARKEAPNSLLFDNGDIIQGNPLGDFIARERGVPVGALHPMFAVMNRMGYDVATLGNHEFNYGLDFLSRSIGGANFPFVCANLVTESGDSYVRPYRIFERTLLDEEGAAHALRIGVIGFVPPQIMSWDRSHLEGKVRCGDILESARRYLPELRSSCDLVIALSHSGINTNAFRSGDENASFHLAAQGGIDAVMTGHSHRVFPGPDYSAGRGIDLDKGTLSGVPAVMPGFWGSHLGVIDLSLARDGDKWTVDNHASEARPIYRRDKGAVISLADVDARVVEAISDAHTATIEWVARPVGTFEVAFHSYFVWAGFDPCSALVNEAQIAYARALLAGTPHAELPILSAAAPFKAGYTPDAYIDIAAGRVALRDVADLYIYPNTVAAVRIKGAAIKDWLEHSARAFNQIDPLKNDAQELVNRRAPSYNFDVIAGLTYKIDVTKPARTSQDGKIALPGANRIVDLAYLGKPIDPRQEFVVVTNNYRADGGGNFPGLDGSSTILRAPDPNLDAIVSYIRSRASIAAPPASPWSFAKIGQNISAAFDSSPAASRYLPDVPELQQIGSGQPGFVQFGFQIS